MRTRIIAVAAVMALGLALSAGDLLAAGRGSGNRGQGGNGTCINAQGSMTRPADSRRRDGTFLATGTTANGSTTRPGNGNGLRDGSGQNLNTNTATAPAAAQ